MLKIDVANEFQLFYETLMATTVSFMKQFDDKRCS